MMKKFIFGLSLLPCAAFADNSGNISVTATVPYILNIQDASVDMQIDNYKEAQTETVQNWSLWSNAAGPLQVSFTSPDNATLESKSGTDPYLTTSLPYTITYKPCGGDPIDVTPRNGGGSSSIGYRYANFDACQQSPGSLTITRLPVNGAPKSGDYISKVVVTVSEPF